jgi:hypothetical protein
MKETELTPDEDEVLKVFLVFANGGPVDEGDIADTLHWSLKHTCRVVDSLLAKGYLFLTPDATSL